jgi:hypothetical protein
MKSSPGDFESNEGRNFSDAGVGWKDMEDLADFVIEDMLFKKENFLAEEFDALEVVGVRVSVAFPWLGVFTTVFGFAGVTCNPE